MWRLCWFMWNICLLAAISWMELLQNIPQENFNWRVGTAIGYISKSVTFVWCMHIACNKWVIPQHKCSYKYCKFHARKTYFYTKLLKFSFSWIISLAICDVSSTNIQREWRNLALINPTHTHTHTHSSQSSWHAPLIGGGGGGGTEENAFQWCMKKTDPPQN